MSDTTIWDGSTIPAAAIALVSRIESFRGAPYQDGGGVWTIGYGTTRINGEPVTADTPAVSEDEARGFLAVDLTGAAGDVRREITVDLLEYEAAALISWTFNLGGGNLERSTMRVKVNQGDKAAAANEMGKWINTAGKPTLGLRRRRWAEASVFLGGDADQAIDRAWSEINAVTDWPAFS